MDSAKSSKKEMPLGEQVEADNYDRGIIPAETAARKDREGTAYKQTPGKAAQAQAKTDEQTDPESIETTDGFTTDKEGLINNFAIEPEMYIDEPGDLREEETKDAVERTEELEEVNEDKQGQLTMEEDKRGRGPGLI